VTGIPFAENPRRVIKEATAPTARNSRAETGRRSPAASCPPSAHRCNPFRRRRHAQRDEEVGAESAWRVQGSREGDHYRTVSVPRFVEPVTCNDGPVKRPVEPGSHRVSPVLRRIQQVLCRVQPLRCRGYRIGVALHRFHEPWNLCTVTKNQSTVAFHMLNVAYPRFSVAYTRGTVATTGFAVAYTKSASRIRSAPSRFTGSPMQKIGDMERIRCPLSRFTCSTSRRTSSLEHFPNFSIAIDAWSCRSSSGISLVSIVIERERTNGS
jgi:hypothetical protein